VMKVRANGKIFTFPDGTSPDEISVALEEYFSAQGITDVSDAPSYEGSPSDNLSSGGMGVRIRPTAENEEAMLAAAEYPSSGGMGVRVPPAGNQFAYVGPPATPSMSGKEVFDQEVVEEPDMLSEITGGIVRGLAPAAIGTAAGFAAGGPPGAMAGLTAGMLTPLVGDPIVRTVNNLLGTTYTVPTDALEDLLTRIGVTDPKTEAGRIAQATAQGVAGAGGIIGAGKSLTNIAGEPLSTLGRVGSTLAAQPGAQLAGGAGAGAAAQTVQEAGGGPTAQLGAALAGGVGGSLATRVPFMRGPQPPVQADLNIAAAESAGIPLMTSDIRPPRTFAGKSLQQFGERIPFLGTGSVRQSQQKARISSVRDLLNQYGAGDLAALSDDVMKDLLKQRKSFITKYVGQKNQVIEKLSGSGAVNIPRTLQKIDEEIARLQSLKRGEEGIAGFDTLIDDLQRTRFSLQNQDLKSLESLRKLIGERYKDPSLAGVATEVQKVYNSLYRPLVEDMGDFIKINGAPQDFNKWMIANKRLANSIDELSKSGGLKAALDKGDVTPELIQKLLFSQKPSEVRLLYRNLSEEGRAKARAAILARAAEKAASEEATGVVVSPDTFKNEINRLGNSIGVMFKGSELDQVNGLARILKLTERAAAAGASPTTGVQLFYNTLFSAGASAGAGYAAGFEGLMGVLGPAATFSAFARAYESAPVRNILIKLSKTRVGSKEEAAVFKRMAAMVQQSEAEEEQEFSSELGTMASFLGL
jgi:hypothetical protein